MTAIQFNLFAQKHHTQRKQSYKSTNYIYSQQKQVNNTAIYNLINVSYIQFKSFTWLLDLFLY